MRHKLLNDLHFLIIIIMAVIVEQIVYAQTVSRCYNAVHRYIRLQSPGSPHSYDGQMTKFRVNGAAFKVNIHQCIQLIKHNVHIVGANAC